MGRWCRWGRVVAVSVSDTVADVCKPGNSHLICTLTAWGRTSLACYKSVTGVALPMMALAIVGGSTALRAQTANYDRQATPIVDQRAPEESKKHTLSLWIGSCDYFVIRLDDAGMEKNRIDQLRDDLSRSLHKPLADTLYVKHYTLYYNAGVQMVGLAFAAVAGAVGAIAITSTRKVSAAKCSRERMAGGWFDSSEVSNARPPLVGDVEVTYAGKTFKARKVLSLDSTFNENSKKPKYGNIKANLFRAMNEDLAAQISAITG